MRVRSPLFADSCGRNTCRNTCHLSRVRLHELESSAIGRNRILKIEEDLAREEAQARRRAVGGDLPLTQSVASCAPEHRWRIEYGNVVFHGPETDRRRL
eukprot:SAG22_NODE_513_length_9567_cov_25.867771_5_plen_99_part_00